MLNEVSHILFITKFLTEHPKAEQGRERYFIHLRTSGPNHSWDQYSLKDPKIIFIEIAVSVLFS